MGQRGTFDLETKQSCDFEVPKTSSPSMQTVFTLADYRGGCRGVSLKNFRKISKYFSSLPTHKSDVQYITVNFKTDICSLYYPYMYTSNVEEHTAQHYLCLAY